MHADRIAEAEKAVATAPPSNTVFAKKPSVLAIGAEVVGEAKTQSTPPGRGGALKYLFPRCLTSSRC